MAKESEIQGKGIKAYNKGFIVGAVSGEGRFMWCERLKGVKTKVTGMENTHSAEGDCMSCPQSPKEDVTTTGIVLKNIFMDSNLF